MTGFLCCHHVSYAQVLRQYKKFVSCDTRRLWYHKTRADRWQLHDSSHRKTISMAQPPALALNTIMGPCSSPFGVNHIRICHSNRIPEAIGDLALRYRLKNWPACCMDGCMDVFTWQQELYIGLHDQRGFRHLTSSLGMQPCEILIVT
jgi:hypothetical protein